MEKLITITKVEYEDGTYGKKQLITDEKGNVWKIPEKRQELWPSIETNINSQVNLDVQEYKGKKYIAGVEIVGIPPTPPSPKPVVQPTPQPSPQPVQSVTSPAKPQFSDDVAPRERGMCLKELGEWFRSGKMDDKTFLGKESKFGAIYWRVYWLSINHGIGITAEDLTKPKT
mgnify:CR=1 FL=1